MNNEKEVPIFVSSSPNPIDSKDINYIIIVNDSPNFEVVIKMKESVAKDLLHKLMLEIGKNKINVENKE
jgi:hypothetical protein